MKLVGPLQEPKFPSCMYHFGTPHLLKIPDFWSMPPQWRKIRRPLRTPLNQNFSIRKLPRWQSLNPPQKKKRLSSLESSGRKKKKRIIPGQVASLSFGRISISNFLIRNPSARPRSAAPLFFWRLILFDAQSTVGNGQDITFPAGRQGMHGLKGPVRQWGIDIMSVKPCSNWVCGSGY